MKIIIFDGTFKTTAFIRRLLQGLIKSGHKVYVLGFNEDNPNPVPQANYIKLGSNQHRTNFLLTSLNWGLKSGKLFKLIGLVLKGKKKQIQHFNLTTALQHIEPDLINLQWISNIKLFESFLEKNQYNFVLSQRGYQTNVRPFVNQENFNYLQKWLPKFDGFHSVSKVISKVGDKLYYYPNKIEQVVYTGLDLAKFHFNSEVVQHKKIKILSVGRSHWIKGYYIAIRALHLLKQANIQFEYQIVGAKGDEELIFLINDLGLEKEIMLLDQLPQNQVFELMKTSSVFLLPSIEEGIANVAVEAMALGCPVISTNCGGMQELITHNKEGWMVPIYDINAMAKQIIDFSKLSKEHIAEVKIAARKKVENQHNEQQMVGGMMELYERIVE